MTVTILVGHAIEKLRGVASNSVHMCCSSPPYYGKRDYGVPPSVWGGDEACAHRWGEELLDRSRRSPGTQNGSLTGDGRYQANACRFEIRSNFCVDCGAWRGALGLEPHPDCGRQFMKLRLNLTADQRSFVVLRLRDEGLLDVALCGMGRRASGRSTSGTSASGTAPTASGDEHEGARGPRHNPGTSSGLDQERRTETLDSALIYSPPDGSNCDRLSSSDDPAPSLSKEEAAAPSAKRPQRSRRNATASTSGPEESAKSSHDDLQGMFDQASSLSRGGQRLSSGGQRDFSPDCPEDSGRSFDTTMSKSEPRNHDRIPGTDRTFDEIVLPSALVPSDLTRLFQDSLCSTCYVCHLVMVFEEVRRVLRPDGTLWLNLGDTYAAGAGQFGDHPGGGEQGNAWAGRPNAGSTSWAGTRGKKIRATRDGSHAGINVAMAALGPMTQPNRMPLPGLKPKDLIGIPWMAAFALRRAGWWLRGENIWVKPNPMPESISDRCTTSHEQVFLLAKSARYFYDAAAVAEPANYAPGCGWEEEPKGTRGGKRGAPQERAIDPEQSFRAIRATRNKRTVWTIATTPFPGAHFATFPPSLVEPCILAGTSSRGCCVECGAPWERITGPSERYRRFLGKSYHDHSLDDEAGMMQHRGQNAQNAMRDEAGITGKETVTLGWWPSCHCDGLPRLTPYPKKPRLRTDGYNDHVRCWSESVWRRACAAVDAHRGLVCDAERGRRTKPAVVLDPFGGACTTAMVADRLQRDALMVELNAEYAEMGRRRLEQDGGMFARAAE